MSFIQFLFLYGGLISLLLIGRTWDWWDDRRHYLDPDARGERILEWARTKNLEDPPSQIDWESFEKQVEVRLQTVGDPWADIEEWRILKSMQKYADEDYRRQQKLENEPFYRDDSRGSFLPQCAHCRGGTELLYPTGVTDIYNTPVGPRLNPAIRVRCARRCGWEGPVMEAFYPCDHEWERFMMDGSGAVRYVCSLCNASLTKNPDLLSEDDLIKIMRIPPPQLGPVSMPQIAAATITGDQIAASTIKSGTFQPEDSPLFPPFETENSKRPSPSKKIRPKRTLY